MGKLRHAARQGPLSLPLTVLALCLAPAAHGEIRFVPTVATTETYTDNVALARDDLAHAQFVSELTAGFTVTDQRPRATISLNYQLHSYLYSGNADGTRRSTSTLQANSHSTLIDELLFLDASASVGQQAVSAFGQQVTDNSYATANRADVKTYQITPSLVHRFGAFATTTVRYTHSSVDAGDGTGLGHSISDTLSANLSSGPAFGRIGWGVQVLRTALDDGITGTTTTQSETLNGSYTLSSSLRLTATLGDEKYDYATINTAAAAAQNTSGRSWSAGFIWTPSARTSLQLSGGKRYFGDTYSMAAMHHSRHTIWNLSYGEDVTTNRDSFLNQSSVSTASMVDSLFSATITDPVARAQAVAAYIAAAGLPATLANNTTYFSNRFQLQKQFQASVGFNASRTTVLFTAANTKRTALSSVQADSDLLGSFNQALNDDTTQRSLNATVAYQLSSRSTLSALASTTRSESLSTGLVDHSKNWRLNFGRQFDTKLRGSVELRRVEGGLGTGFGSVPIGTVGTIGNGVYHENAISATLSLQL